MAGVGELRLGARRSEHGLIRLLQRQRLTGNFRGARAGLLERRTLDQQPRRGHHSHQDGLKPDCAFPGGFLTTGSAAAQQRISRPIDRRAEELVVSFDAFDVLRIWKQGIDEKLEDGFRMPASG